MAVLASDTITSDGANTRSATIAVWSDRIVVTANSKTKVVYTNEPVFRALARYLTEVESDFVLN